MIIRLILAFASISSIAVAQDAIETDRPDQTETATVVGAGRVQIEAGVVYESSRSTMANTFGGGETTVDATVMSIPTVLVRFGLTDLLELRVEGGMQRDERTISVAGTEGVAETVSGTVAPALGFKVELHEESGPLPQMAFIGDLTLPVGEEGYRPEHVAPAFRFTFSHSLGESLALGYNLGAEWSGSDPNGVGIYTVTLAAALTEALGAYVEAFGEMSTGATPMHMLDGGFTLKPMPNLQLDLSGGLALNEVSPDYFFGAGVSVRLPN
jgi:hypothetical protein